MCHRRGCQGRSSVPQGGWEGEAAWREERAERAMTGRWGRGQLLCQSPGGRAKERRKESANDVAYGTGSGAFAKTGWFFVFVRVWREWRVQQWAGPRIPYNCWRNTMQLSWTGLLVLSVIVSLAWKCTSSCHSPRSNFRNSGLVCGVAAARLPGPLECCRPRCYEEGKAKSAMRPQPLNVRFIPEAATGRT